MPMDFVTLKFLCPITTNYYYLSLINMADYLSNILFYASRAEQEVERAKSEEKNNAQKKKNVDSLPHTKYAIEQNVNRGALNHFRNGWTRGIYVCAAAMHTNCFLHALFVCG